MARHTTITEEQEKIALAFGIWLNLNARPDVAGHWEVDFDDDVYTTSQLFDLFIHKTEQSGKGI